MKEQGEGSFLDIINGDYDTLLPIPYWAWIDKCSEVISLLSECKDDKELVFTWPIIKNDIKKCQAFVTGNGIEIVPYHIPIRSFGSFSNAAQRILMSATTQDDSFFIKGLGFSVNAVQNPLVNLVQKWSGEKMILIPSLIDDSLDRDIVVSTFAKPNKAAFGRVALVPSHKRTEQYNRLGANVAQSNTIFTDISSLKNGTFEKTLVIANRYDGIDLPDEACRILIIDSLPYFNSLVDRYEEQCRINSDVINIRLAQKVEQGLGRSVRGEKDYSNILLIGADLVKFIKSIKTNKYFSLQTKKQIEIGFQIAEMAKDDLKADESAMKVLISLINQSLKRDEGWKEFYKEEMDKIQKDGNISDIYDILQLETEAESANFKENNEVACEKIQTLIDKYINNDFERGWYLQILARYKYFISKVESNKIQKSAFDYNLQLLKPKDGITYKKIGYINEDRVNRIKEWISQYKNYEELMLHVDGILNDFTFGVGAEKFENAVKEIGLLLGFISQRPDKEIRKGPDNLWGGVENIFFMIECKSEVSDSRENINKHEAAQMCSHCGWFESEYGKDVKVKRILIISTKKLSYEAHFTHKVEIMKKGKLKLLKDSIKSFIKEFASYNINEIGEAKIQEFINAHKLDLDNLCNLYTEDYYKKER
ncbi:DEAD/DEAH box helicase [Bacteroidia bacterium]|nr:DEAD/DEAH box helicase [Bacteroidia bacterium]